MGETRQTNDPVLQAIARDFGIDIDVSGIQLTNVMANIVNVEKYRRNIAYIFFSFLPTSLSGANAIVSLEPGENFSLEILRATYSNQIDDQVECVTNLFMNIADGGVFTDAMEIGRIAVEAGFERTVIGAGQFQDPGINRFCIPKDVQVFEDMRLQFVFDPLSDWNGAENFLKVLIEINPANRALAKVQPSDSQIP